MTEQTSDRLARLTDAIDSHFSDLEQKEVDLVRARVADRHAAAHKYLLNLTQLMGLNGTASANGGGSSRADVASGDPKVVSFPSRHTADAKNVGGTKVQATRPRLRPYSESAKHILASHVPGNGVFGTNGSTTKQKKSRSRSPYGTFQAQCEKALNLNFRRNKHFTCKDLQGHLPGAPSTQTISPAVASMIEKGLVKLVKPGDRSQKIPAVYVRV